MAFSFDMMKAVNSVFWLDELFVIAG